MIPIYEIPTIIKNKKYGNRYPIESIPEEIKRSIRLDKYREKLSIRKLTIKYNLPNRTINKILKEF